MVSVHTAVLKICVLLSIITATLGFPDQLPDIIQATNENSSTCYGTHTHFQPTCSHRNGTVIAVQAIKVGAKFKSLNCPTNVHESSWRNDTCCLPNTTQDCIQIYDYTDSGIDYKFHRYCSGYPTCIEALQTVNDRSTCYNSTTPVYMDYTNYMFMEYACVEGSKIGQLCSEKIFYVNGTDLPFYLQSTNYPHSIVSTSTLEPCECHVLATSDIMVYMLDVRLHEQTLTISDLISSHIYDKSNATLFNVTLLSKSNQIWITLDNSLEQAGFIWIGLTTDDRTAFTVTCNIKIIEDTSSISPEHPRNRRPALGMIIGIVIGSCVLLLLLILLLCYMCARKARKTEDNTKKETRNDPELQHTREGMTNATPTPMNEKFKSAKIPSNKVEPTCHIQEHGGLKATPLPNIAMTVEAPGADFQQEKMNLPSNHLPPLNVLRLNEANGHNEITTREFKQKRKRKKRKKHKHKKDKDTETDVEHDVVKLDGESTNC